MILKFGTKSPCCDPTFPTFQRANESRTIHLNTWLFHHVKHVKLKPLVCGDLCISANQNRTIERPTCRDERKCSDYTSLCTIEQYASAMRTKCRLTCGYCSPWKWF